MPGPNNQFIVRPFRVLDVSILLRQGNVFPQNTMRITIAFMLPYGLTLQSSTTFKQFPVKRRHLPPLHEKQQAGLDRRATVLCAPGEGTQNREVIDTLANADHLFHPRITESQLTISHLANGSRGPVRGLMP